MTLAMRAEAALSGSWAPRLGARPEGQGVRFSVWAPEAHALEVVVERGGREAPLAKGPDGIFEALVPGVRAGDLYRYRVDGRGPFPDPASRFQPEGVHGPSEVIDAEAFAWTDAGWRGVDSSKLVLYELHVGTFTREGTFAGVTRKLEFLRDLGVTAVEIMPIADFAGTRNWGYDGVDLFAPCHRYGRPDDLRCLVDEAHRLGLGVFLDVVYNHFGPVGNYALEFSPHYLSTRECDWAACVNLDGPNSEFVVEFFLENALHWVHEYHIDGLRLDATHALHDSKPVHFLERLARRVHEATPSRPTLVIAEDHRNLDTMIRPAWAGGWNLDGVWADDFHHQVRRLVAGDNEGYYRDYSGETPDLAETINQGWYYTGQDSIHLAEPRGTDPVGLPALKFVITLQNHDQIGNRAFGDRLNQAIDPASYRSASALLLICPHTPLLFMGQEWAADTPFLYFTDHAEDLGRVVTEGRRREFRHFLAFVAPESREAIPDPQAPSTFEDSRLDWAQAGREPHASTLRLYRRLLALRRELGPASRSPEDFEAQALDPGTVLLRRGGPGEGRLLAISRLKGEGPIDLAGQIESELDVGLAWSVVLTTEDPEFAPEGRRPPIDLRRMSPVVHFSGPCTVIFRAEPRP